MANPTTNYGWPMPTSTDLVTDLPADFAAFGQPVDTSLKALNPETTLGDIAYRSATSNTNTRLGIGTNGQVLAVSGGVPAWTTTADVTPLTTKGDLFTFSTVDARLGVGANDQILVADSTASTGLKWATPAASTPSFVGCFLTKSANQSTANNTITAITFDTEELDTDGFHSTVSNTSRITIPTGKGGKYLIIAQVAFAGNTTGGRYSKIIKNGGADGHDIEIPTSSVSNANGFAQQDILDLAAADYIEIQAGQSSGGSLNVLGDGNGPAKTRFAVTYLGA